MANGILVIDKSAGWTSQDVAAKLRGVFHERRVGHGGTLDPMATGVCPFLSAARQERRNFWNRRKRNTSRGFASAP